MKPTLKMTQATSSPIGISTSGSATASSPPPSEANLKSQWNKMLKRVTALRKKFVSYEGAINVELLAIADGLDGDGRDEMQDLLDEYSAVIGSIEEEIAGSHIQ